MLMRRPPTDLALEVIDFCHTLIVSQGPLAGQKLQLLPWEQDFIIDLFQPDVYTAALTLGRGNGKSTVTAALAAAGMVGPLAKRGAEVVVVAGAFDQARIIFHHAHAFMEPWMGEGRRRWNVTDTTQKAEIVDKASRITLKVKASNPKSAHGLAPSLLLLDEPAQWPANTSRKMLAALEYSMGKIGDEKMIALGTRPEGGDHWFAEWLDGQADVVTRFAADPEEDDLMSDDAWKNANPSWPYMPALVQAILRDKAKALLSPDSLQAYKALRLNLGVGDVYTAILISAEEWQRCATNLADMRGPTVWGLDMGASAAMSAISCYWPMTGYSETVAMFPAEPDLMQRGQWDGVGDLYDQMAYRGELAVTEGRTVKPEIMIQEAYMRWGLPVAIAGDRFKTGETLDALEASGIPLTAWVPRGQGYKDGSEDVKRFRKAVGEDRVKAKESLLMTHALGGARVAIDLSGNAKLAKHGDGTERHSRHRDDAVASLIIAVAEGDRMMHRERPPDPARLPTPEEVEAVNNAPVPSGPIRSARRRR